MQGRDTVSSVPGLSEPVGLLAHPRLSRKIRFLDSTPVPPFEFGIQMSAMNIQRLSPNHDIIDVVRTPYRIHEAGTMSPSNPPTVVGTMLHPKDH